MLILCTTRMIGYNCLTNTDRSENSILLGYGHCVISFRPFENKAVVLSVRVEDTWIFRHLKWRQHVTSKRREPIIHRLDEKFRTKKVMCYVPAIKLKLALSIMPRKICMSQAISERKILISNKRKKVFFFANLQLKLKVKEKY